MNLACMAGVYEIINSISNHRYVGSTIRIDRRWNEHRSQLDRGIHKNHYLQASWTKYGHNVFRFRVVLLCDRSNLLLYEQLALNALQPEYNILAIAGSSIGRIHTPETRAKIAAKAIGRKWSQEAKAKLSATITGRTLSPEHAAKLIGNKHALGHKHTDEWKRDNSLRNTGFRRPKSPEYRAKIAATLICRKATAEHRANQAAAQRGKKRGPYKKQRGVL